MPGRSYSLFLVFVLCSAASAQQACPPIPVPTPDPSKIFFSPKQEMELGEIIRQQSDREFHVIEDPQVTGYLDRIGQQIARQLPDTGMHYQFVLYDLPQVQAFSAPGGRVYVSQKLVAFLKNEDELAGLLGHEMGHLAARQQATDLTRLFKEVLGLKSIAEDDDLFDLYNQFVESVKLKKRHSDSSGNEEHGQSIADRIGVEAVTRAGYAPQAFPGFLDRLMETKGRTGNWLTDVFGATGSDSRRLREALRDVSNVPAACIAPGHTGGSDEFQRWQSAVLHYRGIGHAEQLTGVTSRKKLNNPLRGEVEDFRFSPNGKYLLAQDDGGIYVLTRDPFQFLFRIDASDAQTAQFSPDSQQVVFFSSRFRVESWDIVRQEQVSYTDVPVLHGCLQSALSPDAKFLACFDGENLFLFDVASGEILYRMDHFLQFESMLNPYANFFRFVNALLTHAEMVVLRFSPDAHYFAASSHTGEEIVFDLNARQKMNVPGAIHSLMGYSFTFVGPDRIVGVDTQNAQKSPIAEFPSGKIVDRVPLGGGTMVAATNPNYILLRPVINFPVGGYGLAEKRLVFTERNSATDIWGDFAVGERLNGEIALYKVGETKAFAVAQLPYGNLGSLSAFAVSPDLNFLAISSRTRGGIWNLETNQRVFHVRSFQSAYFNSHSAFFLDFPKFEKADREMAVASPITGQTKGRPVEKDEHVTFFGDVLFRITYADKSGKGLRNYKMDALDMSDQRQLWSRTFPKQGPLLAGSPSSGKVVFVWNANSDGVRNEVARDPRLQALWDKRKPKEGDYLFEVLDSHNGNILGGVIVLTGKRSFSPEGVEAAGDWLAVGDNVNRVLLYSISSGEQVARWFGNAPEISPNGMSLSLANGRGHIVVYDLNSLKQTSDLYFSSAISLDLFSADGAKLFVLTDDQTAFQIDVAAYSHKAASN